MVDKLEAFLRRYNELSKKLADSDIISNSESFKKFSIEFKEIEPIVLKYGELKKVEHDILEAKELSGSEDGELSSFGKEELEELQRKKESILADIKLFLIPKDPLEDKNIIMEIRAGVGGEEAALFARDLFRMYIGFAEKRGWKTELLDSHATDIGGFKEVIFSISGKDVYKYLKYEIGVHRVQRVPETEASGRIHTSTATVAVLPEAEEVDYEINPDDLRIDVFHASGHGGQNVQKVATAIRIVHKPTGIMVTCQDERSQLQNKVKAMRILRARLFDMYEQEKEKEIVDKRRAQIGRGNRNERIRTYNFPQGRVTDHRINISLFNIQEFMEGNIDELVNSLIEEEQKERLEEIEN